MRKMIPVLMICVAIVLVAVPPALAEEEPTSTELKQESKRVAIDEVAEETLQKLFSEKADAKSLYDKAIGWAVFDNTKVAFGISGGGGNGVAVSKTSGKKAYMKMGTGGVGFGIGVNKYQVVFFFESEKILKKFIESGWQADAGATASAGKHAADAKTNFVNGLAIYQLTEKGLMANADIAGTKYWLNDKLNE